MHQLIANILALEITSMSFDAAVIKFANRHYILGRWKPRGYYPHFQWSKTFKCVPIPFYNFYTFGA